MKIVKKREIWQGKWREGRRWCGTIPGVPGVLNFSQGDQRERIHEKRAMAEK